jgi:vacuolar-type H+-ATPase subunit I/STV1
MNEDNSNIWLNYLNIYSQYYEGDTVILIGNKSGLRQLKSFTEYALSKYDEYSEYTEYAENVKPSIEADFITTDGIDYKICFVPIGIEEENGESPFEPLYFDQLVKSLNKSIHNLSIENKKLREDLANYTMLGE